MDYPADTYPLPSQPPMLPTPPSTWLPLADNGRWLALPMQVKDSVQIVAMLLDGTLIFGVICGIGLPGLLLYVLRWRQLRRPVGRVAILVQGGLSLAHEVFWARVFQDDVTSSDPITHHSGLLAGMYWLGAALMAGQLLLVAFGPFSRPAAPSLAAETQVEEA